MRYLVRTLSVLVLSFGFSDAWADQREVVLNYADPHGAALALALVSRADQIPEWMRGSGATSGGKDEGGDFAFRERSESTIDAHTTYMFSARRSNSEAAGGPLDETRIELSAGPGWAVEIRRTNEVLVHLPQCSSRSARRASCRISDLGRDVLAFTMRHATSSSARLDALLAAHGLVEDVLAAKRVVTTLDAKNQLNHIDFVGMVRGKTEQLPAPDATSVYVVRLDRNGVFTVVQRLRDSSASPAQVKFAFEEQ